MQGAAGVQNGQALRPCRPAPAQHAWAGAIFVRKLP